MFNTTHTRYQLHFFVTGLVMLPFQLESLQLQNSVFLVCLKDRKCYCCTVLGIFGHNAPNDSDTESGKTSEDPDCLYFLMTQKQLLYIWNI